MSRSEFGVNLAETLDDAERHTWSDDRGSIEFLRPREGIALMVLTGKLGDEAAAAWEQHFPWLLGAGSVSLFMDGAQVTLPNSTFISTGTRLTKDAKSRFDELHVLVDGVLVEMTAKTANLAIGGIMRITRERAKFEAEIDRVLRR